MSAPVTTVPSSTPAASALSGASAGASVSLNPLGGNVFSSLLSSMGMANFTMASVSADQTGEAIPVPAGAVANTDAQSLGLGKNGALNLQSALLVSADQLTSMSQEDLKSLLASFGDTSDELSPKVLVAMAPGVPAQETFDNIKAKFAELGVDTSNFQSVAMQNAAQTTPALPDANSTIPENTLTVPTAEAAQSANFLLITTGLTPADMAPVKAAIKVAADTAVGDTTPTDPDKSTDDLTSDDDMNAAAAANMVLVLLVVPTPKPIEAPAAQDMNFDLSALSAFTQTQGTDTPEPDWTKKLSDKLSGMSLSDDASPFDDEMNDILSFKPAASAAGFQGSIASSTAVKKEAAKLSKDVSGEVSPQATLSASQLANLSSNALQNVSADGLLMANGNMVAAQNAQSPLTNPLFTSTTATSAHPSVQAVAVLIGKVASGSDKAKQELSVQLDPPELGRMQVQLSMEKDGVMKVHLTTERQETLSLFQRDAHALKSMLDSAGIQVDNSSLSFDMASSDQSFNQLMGGSQQDRQSSGSNSSRSLVGISTGGMEISDRTIDTKMSFMADKVTGNVHYSFFA